ncbi:putative T7SS-secreted protein [Saccharomonospora glauca]|uniref:Putative T7SS secretion signal domain-containing protein n=1 Tax=Saccharomonospora glauca K62 TaxID=928724 RepID=I1CZ57_9PSEU|nr:hypothetical protein [Saccharomonospora glauca]EIE97981.1 hypothetical protein SacglDRAFT_01046 [Saccharomonospora glauca K62]
MAELGQTTNPKDLIPGEPETIIEDLRELTKNIEAIGLTGDGLGTVDPAGWTGEAASTFRDVFSAEPPKWFRALEQTSQGGEALADYADILVWAQGEAQRAIEMYTEAQAASRAAAAQYDAQVQQAAATGAPIAPFNDPGASVANEARAILDNARNELSLAGDLVARKLGFEPDGQGGYKRNLGSKEWGSERREKTRVWDPETGQWVERDPGGWQRHGPGGSWSGKWGSQSDGMLRDKIKEVLGQLGIEIPEKKLEGSANVDVLGGKLDGEFSSGDWSGKGSLEGSLLGAGAEGNFSTSVLGVNVGGSAEAYLAKGGAEGELSYGDYGKLSGKAQGIIGVEASGNVSVGFDGVQANLGAFAGGKVDADLSAEAGGITVGVHGEARYGAGADASAQFGMGDDGKFHIGVSAGLALGLGAKGGFDVAIDPGEFAGTVVDVGSGIMNAASNVGNGIANALGF